MPSEFVLVVMSAQYSFLSAVMLCLYSKIFLVAHQQKMKIQATAGVLGPDNLVKDTKTAKTLAIVLGAFLFSWTPFFTLCTVQALGYQGEQVFTVYVVGILMAILNSALNPIIYCWKSSEFRTAYARLLRRLCRKA